MTQALWDWGFGESLSQFRTAVDRLFDTFGGDQPWRTGWEPFAYPPLALSEDSERFHVEAELPGVRLDDLEITCLARTLTLRGKRKSLGEPDEAYEQRERPTGTFVRTIELPTSVRAAEIRATLEDGILRITIPKAEPDRTRRIEIRTAAPAAELPEAPTMKEEE